jgi:hypothetical protein
MVPGGAKKMDVEIRKGKGRKARPEIEGGSVQKPLANPFTKRES